MAARNKLWHPNIVRQRIKTSQLLNRLQGHALGEIEMTDSQRKATETLLKKTLPDLSSVALTNADGDGPPELHITATDVRG